MSRTTPMWLLCKGEVSRVRDGPAFFVLPRQRICTQMRGIGLLVLASGPANWSVFRRSQKAKLRGNQHVRRKSSQG
jgi:hypothetical protein